MNPSRSRRPLLLTILGVAVLAAVIAGLAIPLYTAPGTPTNGVSSLVGSTQSQNPSSSGSLLALSGAIPLPSTQGRIDHMAVDLSRGLLFVACYANNTVGIVDLRSGHLMRSIGGLSNPQGVAWVPDAGKLFVSNAGDGTVVIFDGSSFAQVGKLTLAGDADNLRFDGGTKLLYVGFGSGGIAAINVATNSVVSTRALPAHPESFQLEAHGRAVYANVPPSNLVVAFDKFTVWQLATYMFLHGGVFHILFNMLALWMFGAELERTWGTNYFLKFYFVTGIGAAVRAAVVEYDAAVAEKIE